MRKVVLFVFFAVAVRAFDFDYVSKNEAPEVVAESVLENPTLLSLATNETDEIIRPTTTEIPNNTIASSLSFLDLLLHLD